MLANFASTGIFAGLFILASFAAILMYIEYRKLRKKLFDSQKSFKKTKRSKSGRDETVEHELKPFANSNKTVEGSVQW